MEPYGVPVSAITSAIADAVNGLLGADLTVAVGPLSGMANIAVADMNALARMATPDQIVNVVFLNNDPKSTKGGFFPKGLRGLLGRTRGVLRDICNGKSRAKRWNQCGGKFWKGPTCCSKFNTCVFSTDMYSQCEPTALPANLVGWYKQCGGMNYDGPTTCEPRSECEVVNKFYSMCHPIDSSKSHAEHAN